MSHYSSHTSVDEKEALLLKLGTNDEAVGDRFVLHNYDRRIVEALRHCTVVSHLKVLATSNLLHGHGRDDEMHLHTYLSTGNALRIVTFDDEDEDFDEVALPMAPTLTAWLLRAVWINPNVTALKVLSPSYELGDLIRLNDLPSSIEDLEVYLHEFENDVDNDYFAQSFGVNTTLRSLTLCSGEEHDSGTLMQRVLDSLAAGTQLESLWVDCRGYDFAPSLESLILSSATPRLQNLNLDFATFTDQSANSFCASLRISQSVEKLVLANCTFPDADSLVKSFVRPDNNNSRSSSIRRISIDGGTFGAATPCELVAALFFAPTSTLSVVGLWHDDNGQGDLFEALSGASIVPIATDADGTVGYRSLAIGIHNRAELNQLLHRIPGFGKLRSLMVSLDLSNPLPSARFVRAIHQNGNLGKLSTNIVDECWERPVTANSSTTARRMIEALLERNGNLARLLNTPTDTSFHNGHPIVPENVIRLRPPLLVAALPAGQGVAAGFVSQNVLRGLLTLPQEL